MLNKSLSLADSYHKRVLQERKQREQGQRDIFAEIKDKENQEESNNGTN